ncbi:MAG TPA: hypothetical protein VFQ68_31390 [Streptosporangiaceae bacterium]|nr:hypothetical protein [Streptosporangiaceae bacterium]
MTPNAEYYALGHLARFVRPGAVRIASTASPAGPADPCCTGDVAANAADGQGTGQFTVANLSGAQVRYVKMTLTASSGSWWSVADVRAYTR